jgi:hypothetical protein
MPDEVRVNKNEGIIEIISSGDLTINDMQSTDDIIQNIFAENGIYQVLIDQTRVQSFPDTFKIFDFCKSQFTNFRIAILTSISSPLLNDAKFMETVGHNWGRIVKVFYDEKEARQWLSKFKG